MAVANATVDLSATFKTLNCTICRNILSVAPVMTISSEEYQCGRCQNIQHGKATLRNTIYESLAQHFEFPCMNDNCKAMLSWKDVEEHEKDCLHTTIICPMFHENCEEKISLKDVTLHMIQKHGNNILFEKIELTVPMFKSFVCVAVINAMEFLIYICQDKVLVTSLKPFVNNLTYSLKLNSTEKDRPSLLFEKQEIEGFNERKHCFRCLDKRCDLQHHPYSTFYVSKSEVHPVANDNMNMKLIKRKETRSSQSAGISKPSLIFSPVFNGTTYKPTSIFAPLNNETTSKHSTICLVPVTAVAPVTVGTTSSGSIFGAPVPNTFTFSTPQSNNDKANKPADLNEVPSTDQKTEIRQDRKSAKANSQVKTLKCTKFNISHIQNLIGISPSVIFTIQISTDEDESNQASDPIDSFIPRNLLHTIDNSDILRKVFECPICNEFMVDKIYVCERGHQICSMCKSLNSGRGSCPSCMGVLGDSRSIALETLAEECSLCCCYRDRGCEFRGNLKTICKHDKNCELQKK